MIDQQYNRCFVCIRPEFNHQHGKKKKKEWGNFKKVNILPRKMQVSFKLYSQLSIFLFQNRSITI